MEDNYSELHVIKRILAGSFLYGFFLENYGLAWFHLYPYVGARFLAAGIALKAYSQAKYKEIFKVDLLRAV